MDKLNCEMRSFPVSQCPLCGAEGELLYSGIRDRLFGAPGDWKTRRCVRWACGALWLDPKPVADDIVKAYQGYYTHQAGDSRQSGGLVRRFYEHVKNLYLAKRYGYGPVPSLMQAALAKLIYLYPPGRADLDLKVFFLPARPGARLLEVGCGSGEMLKWLEERGWQVEGLDFDPQAVDNARSRGMRIYSGDLQGQGLAADCYDAIVMNHVIEHVPDPYSLLGECHRLLKPGGTLVSVTPNARSLGHRIFGSSWFHLDPPRHLILFSPAALLTAAESLFSGSAKVFSTIRSADGPLAASICIGKTGRFLMSGKAPLHLRVAGRCLQMIEWTALFFTPWAGEEIILVASKAKGKEPR